MFFCVLPLNRTLAILFFTREGVRVCVCVCVDIPVAMTMTMMVTEP
jgi:hypothetical protein